MSLPAALTVVSVGAAFGNPAFPAPSGLPAGARSAVSSTSIWSSSAMPLSRLRPGFPAGTPNTDLQYSSDGSMGRAFTNSSLRSRAYLGVTHLVSFVSPPGHTCVSEPHLGQYSGTLATNVFISFDSLSLSLPFGTTSSLP